MESWKQDPEASGKQMGVFSSPQPTSLIEVLALLLTCCVTSSKSLSFSELQMLICQVQIMTSVLLASHKWVTG